MISERYHFAYPFVLIVLVSLAVLGSRPDRAKEWRFNAILDRIGAASAEEVPRPLAEAESFILFQQKVLSPKTGEDTAQTIADLYFQLGNALMSRAEPAYVDRARDCFISAVDLYPTLRQGWAHYLLGQIYEQYENVESIRMAKPYYEQVSLFNSGELSLKAGFRLASLALRLNEPPIDSKILYSYIRFASKEIANDLRPFAAALFDEQDESIYLRAATAQNQGDRDAATALWRQYLNRRPVDYSARCQLARSVGDALNSLYPENGDLLSSCFAPRAFSDGQLLLLHNQHIRADFYAANPGAHPFEITVALENPFEKNLLLYVTVNDQIRSLTVAPRRESQESFRFDSIQERNLIDFHALKEDGDSSSANPPWIRIRSLSAHLIAPESSS